MHSRPGLFTIHTELLTVIVMQDSGSCNMTTSLVADDPNAYMVKMCSPGYYGPLCSLCLLHNAPPGEARYGRTGNLNCQKCRCVPALSCSLLGCLASCCLCCLCIHLADTAVDASCRQHSVNIGSTVIACPAHHCDTAATRLFCRKLQLQLSFMMRLMRALHLSRGCAQASVAPEWLQHCIDQMCCVMQVQYRLWLLCKYLSCLCRKSSTIVIADIASTSLVMLWLMYIIHVTLRENEEDAQNTPKPVRVSEFLKVRAACHHHFLAAV